MRTTYSYEADPADGNTRSGYRALHRAMLAIVSEDTTCHPQMTVRAGRNHAHLGNRRSGPVCATRSSLNAIALASAFHMQALSTRPGLASRHRYWS